MCCSKVLAIWGSNLDAPTWQRRARKTATNDEKGDRIAEKG